MSLEDILAVTSSEGVPIEFELAGVGTRISALLADYIFLLLSFAIIFYIFGVSIQLMSVTSMAIYFVALATFAAFVFVFGYFIFCEAVFNGLTIGKFAAGIRVISLSGGRISFNQALTRNLLRIVDMQPGFTYLVGIISLFLTTRVQRIGDLASQCVVVRYREPPKLFSRKKFIITDWRSPELWPTRFFTNPYLIGPSPTNLSMLPEHLRHLDTSHVTEQDLLAINAFLTRRYWLPPDKRAHLASLLANQLRVKLGSQGYDLADETLLEAVSFVKTMR